jgi:hypothetical protein
MKLIQRNYFAKGFVNGFNTAAQSWQSTKNFSDAIAIF